MKVKKNISPAELSYYGLYLLDYLRKYHPDKVIDIEFITGREEAASETFEKERAAGSTVEAAQEEAMRILLEGLHFSPYALLLEVVENEFADEVAASDREAFCREIFPHLEKLVCRLSHNGRHIRPVARTRPALYGADRNRHALSGVLWHSIGNRS